MTAPSIDRSERVYRLLLRVYPARFRVQYGTDVVELFRDRLAEARSNGAWAVLRLWLRTVPNVVIHGVLERWNDVRSGLRGAGPGVLARGTFRSIRRSPGLTLAIVLTLGVGIGANVALFGVLRGVLLRPLPYPEPDRLVQLWETNPEVDGERHGPSPLNFVDWRASASAFESMAAWHLTSGTYRTDGWVEEIRSAQVTVDFFRTLGVEPEIGRGFRPEEVVRYGPLVLSHGLWQRRFGGDPAVVGSTVISSGSSYEIVGVMPADFSFPDESVEAWIAWDMTAVYADRPETRTWRFLHGIGRLGPGQTIETAEEELDVVAAALAERYPETTRGWDAAVSSLHEDTIGDVRGTLWLAFGAVGFILLIACANVANLLLARVPARLREIGVRSMLGASRRRIAAETLCENLLIGLLSGAVGLACGAVLLEGLLALDAGGIPRLGEVRLDPAVFAFTATVAVLTSLLFGSAPLLQLLRGAGSGLGAHGFRTTGSRRQRNLRETFVGSQIAVAVVLLTGAGLFASSLDRLTRVDPGLDPEGVVAFRVSMDPVDGTEGEIVRYYDGLLDAVRGVPGVVDAGASQTLPLNPISNDFRRPYRPAGSGLASADAPSVQMRIVTPRYPAVMGMTLLDGSAMPESTTSDDPLVAIVNETLARELWPTGRAVGRTFEIDFREGWRPYTVTGVVRDVRHYGLRSETLREVFLPHAQMPYLAMNVVAATDGRAAGMNEALRRAVLEYRPTQPPHDFVSMEELMAASTAEERFLSVLLGVLATIGLGLATTGVYGVISYSVRHRRREIGVRMALGARPRIVVGAVLRRALAVSAAGLAAGLLGVLVFGGVVEGLLFGVSARDPVLTAGVAVALTLIAGVAAYVPARRAAWVSPSEALRAE